MTTGPDSSGFTADSPSLMIRLPTTAAGRALLVQIAAVPLTAGVTYSLAWTQVALLSLALTVMLQGVLAAALAACLRQAVWWLPIHFLFPIAITAVHRWNLPPAVFFAGFALCLGLYWTTFRTQVPFYPSGRRVWDAVLDTLPAPPVSIIDVGSGMGGLVMHLARCRSNGNVCGIEAAPFPFLVSLLRNAGRLENCRFRWGRYESVDLGEFDVVFAYLSPVAMPALWEKACREMRPGSVLYSYEFTMPGKEPGQVIPIVGMKTLLYRWVM